MSLKQLIKSPLQKETRFRCYKLSSPGSSFSYFDSEKFILIEARLPEGGTLQDEMKKCNVSQIDTLHITSWDQDHCNLSSLETILSEFHPKKIQYPGYPPSTETARKCLREIQNYVTKNSKQKVRGIKITPEYIKSLPPSKKYGYNNILFHPKTSWPRDNDNSTVKFFRSGMFNVLSLGDIEHKNIGAAIKNSKRAKETDILILPHHGAENDILTRDFLRTIKPRIAVCSSNYDNRYQHPRPCVRNLLSEQGIPLFTTKSKDILIKSTGNHIAKFEVFKINDFLEKEPEKNRPFYYSKKFNALK